MQFIAKIGLFFLIFITGCQTMTPISSGIQIGFEALNPAAIIAVPIFIQPDLNIETASIDHSILISENIIQKFENKIMTSFKNQPNIHGYDFEVVKKNIQFNYVYENSQNNDKSTWSMLNMSLKNIANRFISRDTKTRLLITPQCLAQNNFIEFYEYCLSNDPQWLENLNQLSEKILNADTALITVLTNLKSTSIENLTENQAAISVLLVDTNNGKLIWGNSNNFILSNKAGSSLIPDWNDLINQLLNNEFWNNFPGRIGQNPLLENSTEETKS